MKVERKCGKDCATTLLNTFTNQITLGSELVTELE